MTVSVRSSARVGSPSREGLPRPRPQQWRRATQKKASIEPSNSRRNFLPFDISSKSAPSYTTDC